MARLESGEKAEEKKTIESMRKFDETTVEPDDAGKNKPSGKRSRSLVKWNRQAKWSLKLVLEFRPSSRNFIF